ncbi:MAG: metallophosphoesterase [Desulforudis sp.]|jgi:putative phosphoesterase|nr:MAG: metallophosphoesterase [Desulforudis sp.]
MERIAVISDIHGNLPAFNAVLADIDRIEVNGIYCTGDLVGYGPFPNEVVSLIRERAIPTVLGNYDDGVAFNRMACGCDYPDPETMAVGSASIDWTKANLSEENRNFLRSLPARKRVSLGTTDILLVHGSPRALNEYLYEESIPDLLPELKRASHFDVLVAGHTHRPYVWQAESVLVVNPGSVGQPRDGDPRAAYALLGTGDKGKVTASIVRVNYDIDRTVQAIKVVGLPESLGSTLVRGKR